MLRPIASANGDQARARAGGSTRPWFSRPSRASCCRRTICRRLVQGGRAKKLPRVSFHALRHTHASMLIRAGVDILTISRRLGHGKPERDA